MVGFKGPNIDPQEVFGWMFREAGCMCGTLTQTNQNVFSQIYHTNGYCGLLKLLGFGGSSPNNNKNRRWLVGLPPVFLKFCECQGKFQVNQMDDLKH